MLWNSGWLKINWRTVICDTICHALKCHNVTFVKFRSNYQDIQDFWDSETLISTHLGKLFILSMRNLIQVQIKYFIRVDLKTKLRPWTAELTIPDLFQTVQCTKFIDHKIQYSFFRRPRFVLIESGSDTNYPLPTTCRLLAFSLAIFHNAGKLFMFFFIFMIFLQILCF